MMLKALIIEQLDVDGTLRTFRMRPSNHMDDIVVAFLDEYEFEAEQDQNRMAPFHFLEPGDQSRFEDGFGACRARKIGGAHFYKNGDKYNFKTSWSGIPTERNSLSYYAISLPEFAIPVSLVISDPHQSGKEYRRKISRDDVRHRYIVYLECSSAYGRFDFSLGCEFTVDQEKFFSSYYNDIKTEKGIGHKDEWKRWISIEGKEKIRNFFEQEENAHKIPYQQEPASEATTRVLCIAAAQVEFEAVRCRLEAEFGNESLVFLDKDRTKHGLKFVDSQNDTMWYLVGLSFQGQIEVAHAASSARQLTNPTIIIMVGMCMGMPDRHLSVGTVVVPNEIFGFDHRRLTLKGEQIRPHAISADTGLYQVARIISGRQKKYNVVADKGLASSSVKIEHANSRLIKYLQKTFTDVVAFDMEGFGFYKAVEKSHCLWVKGVADSGEPQQVDMSGREHKQAAQDEATGNAIDFALQVVRSWSHSQPVHQRT